MSLRRPSFDQYESDIHLLPTSSYRLPPVVNRYSVPRKPVPASQSSSYEPYRPIITTEEITDPKETLTVPKGWPARPTSLHRRKPLLWLVILCDAILTLLPMVFIVFGACALSLDNKPLSRFGAHITDAAKLGPTVFPIIYAAIVGRLMKYSALWCAERGANLGLLEQLIGSQNLAGAVERIVMLRRFSIVGFAIVLVWGFSPLGGQSSLRILTTQESAVSTTKQIYYFDLNDTVNQDNFAFSGADNLEYLAPAVSAIYSACLLAPQAVGKSAVDLWNNVKIPLLDELSPKNPDITENPWITVNHTQNLTYSSLTGIMIAGLPLTGRSNFSIESSYIDLECADGVGINSSTDSLAAVLDGKIQFHKVSDLFYGVASTYGVNSSNSFFIDSISNFSKINPEEDYLNLVYGSNLGDDGLVWLYNCSIAAARVESRVSCDGDSCSVDQMRRSEKDTRPSSVTPFHFVSFDNFFAYFPWAAGLPHDGIIDPTDLYVLGNTSPFESMPSYGGTYANISAQVFSKRLSTLINTVWQAGLAPTATAIAPTSNLTAYAVGEGDFLANATTAVVSDTITVYAASHLWIGFLLVISLILQLCSIAGVVLKYMATAPDILGYVSSLTRDNPFVRLPDGGNTIDGLERARLLRDMQVQIGDVRWEDDEKGHVAFRVALTEEARALGILRKGRLYF